MNAVQERAQRRIDLLNRAKRLLLTGKLSSVKQAELEAMLEGLLDSFEE